MCASNAVEGTVHDAGGGGRGWVDDQRKVERLVIRRGRYCLDYLVTIAARVVT